MSDTDAVFTGLIDLASEALGGRAVDSSDDFFASMSNLVAPGRGEWRDGEFTDRGKWMDGWESRRRRDDTDHDWCVVSLGAPGRVRGLDIDTNHFLGNFPPYAAVDVGPSADGPWSELLAPAPLRGGAHNLFAVGPSEVATHVRLRIYPDGGVARLRVWGEVVPRWPDAPGEEIDLACLTSGGLALACSDMFFSPMQNILLPRQPTNMGEGWETRRRRGPGHDWIVVRLGARGTIRRAVIDTRFFKGNYPARAALRVVDAAGATIPELVSGAAPWETLLPETPLGPDAAHELTAELAAAGPATHARLDIYPDGGVARLRLYGVRAP